MTATTRPAPLVTVRLLLIGLFSQLVLLPSVHAGPKPETYWQVDDVRPGMKGFGRTVLKGTKLESFDAEVLGVLKNTSPGRDMILCRLSGMGLEKTGVIAGMSGSPIYLDGKLLGAVAYAWAYGKEPIAGITPFSQMHGYVEAYERRDLAGEGTPTRVGLREPLRIEGRDYAAVTVSQGPDFPTSPAGDSLFMTPLRTPLAVSGFTEQSLKLLGERLNGTGIVPMQGGSAPAKIVEEEKSTTLQPGSSLSVALVTGDFDMSGIGTVTHVEGNRVYGWGHPFFGIGACDYPLMTGYIHAVYPRQSVSFKMGSPLRTVGVVNADVSTCIAGWLDRKPDMMPLRVTVSRGADGPPRTFNVEIARQRSLMATLIYSVLVNSVDMEGELPDEMTTELYARIDVEGYGPVEIRDTFAGSSFSGARAPQNLFNQISSIVHLLNANSYKPLRITRVDCEAKVLHGRRTAEVESAELESETYAPGETLKVTAFLRPYKGAVQRLPLTLKLPADLPEGSYSVMLCDDLTNARLELRDNPTLTSPQAIEQVLVALRLQTAAKRTNLVLRVPTSAGGVALAGKALPDLPPGMVHLLGSGRRTGAQAMNGALVSKLKTDWVVLGSETLRFTVTKNKRLLEVP